MVINYDSAINIDYFKERKSISTQIKHLKLESCGSTQTVLREQAKQYNLCSTQLQSEGRGRGENIWEQPDCSLAFSFILPPCEVLTLTSLEVGILVHDFLLNEYSVATKLKWPNDIHNQLGEKIGGILLHNSQQLTIGIGLNWAGTDNRYSSLFPEQTIKKDEYHTIPRHLYEYILAHRLSPQQIINSWNNYCSHLNKAVKITDNKEILTGMFKGIGPHGEALIENRGIIKSVFTGSLFIMD